MPVVIENHPDRQDRPVQPFLERTKIGRELLGQHRHHPVGEIGAVAAFQGLPVQGRAGGDIMGHIGDGDQDLMSAIFGRRRPHRIVMVAGVRRVDGDQRNGA